MSRIYLFIHNHPTRFAAIFLAATLVPVWFLTGDMSPLP